METQHNVLQALFVKIIFALPFLLITSFLYVYLSALNPIVYLNLILWLFFAFLLGIPILLFAQNNAISKILTTIIIGIIAVYLIYGMKSTIFSNTAMSAILNNGSTWLPKVKFGDLFTTLTSFEEYKTKLDFYLKFSTTSISYKTQSGTLGSEFTNTIRIIECLGLFVIPLYNMFKPRNK